MSKHCKYCKKTIFKAFIKRPGIIDLKENKPKILKEIENKFAYEVVECLNCGKTLTNDDLVGTVICENCKKEIPEDSLIKGVCVDCYLAKNRPDLSNLAKEDLIKKILNLEKEI
ncbi:hypothetical protein FDF50_19220 [Clostridium botulinum]|uniref:Uncharacterized protein n=1 Tax=Clostridium botulinum TaxID=1491 RepID=A0A6G4HXI1_CLOBO|nr:hypothetical protein [Clostridium botulinum]MBD5589521.1 hypothetical protein [Clostridium botulinum]MBO0581302.1 hypothetical protein [Clostridium botulinum]NFJ63301.1 hypothetical protein [Clostridium botulinum]NFJ70419.1 hypothetical protein [Clostridium botulinum]NFQ66031.1 hypothetical protein [Clostridium botulinum]